MACLLTDSLQGASLYYLFVSLLEFEGNFERGSPGEGNDVLDYCEY